MAAGSKKEVDEARHHALASAAWDRMQQVPGLVMWDPMTLARAFVGDDDDDGLFADPKAPPPSYLFRLDVPGIRAEQLEVTVSDGHLHILALGWYPPHAPVLERSMMLPPDADVRHLRAELAGGVLAIRCPRGRSGQGPHQGLRTVAVQDPARPLSAVVERVKKWFRREPGGA